MTKTIRPNMAPQEVDGGVLTVKRGNIEDFDVISSETESENLRMIGALGEMLFEHAKKSFRVESLLVIAQNEDFKVVMFPADRGFVVWKTNLEVKDIIRKFSE